MTDALEMILLLPVLLLCSAIASGSETALFRLSFRERAELKRSTPAVGAAVAVLLSDPRRLLLMILIINMVVNIAYFVVSSILTTRVEHPAVGAAVGAGSVLAIVLFGEILAKVLAGTGRHRFCMIFARPLATLLVLAGPVLTGIDRFVLSPLIRLVRPHAPHAATVGTDELRSLVESGRESGVLDESERLILAEVIELGELRVREATRRSSPWPRRSGRRRSSSAGAGWTTRSSGSCMSSGTSRPCTPRDRPARARPGSTSTASPC